MTRGANSGRDPAGHETGEIERNISVDYDNRGLVNHSPFSEASNHAERTHIGSVAITASIGAVELRALGDARTLGAEMMQASPAPAARSAAGNKGQHDVVTRFNAAHRGADFLDHTSGLVAEHHRPHRHAALTAHHMIVGAAQAYGDNTHQNFSRCRRIEFDALNRYRCADGAKKSSYSIHELYPAIDVPSFSLVQLLSNEVIQ
jgi:hypothetical protein